MLRTIRSPFLYFGVAVVLTTGLALVFMPGLLTRLISPGFFMPHSHCYLNDPAMLWLQGLSDSLIGLAYMVLAGGLAYLVFKARKDIPFEWMFLAFGLFIFSCGWTHLMEVWTLWHPTYWLSGLIKAVTAVASLATAVGFFFVLPHIFGLIHTAKASEQRRLDLAKAHANLEQAYREMEAFSYSLSHDIRAPVRAVRNYSGILLEEYRDRLGPEGGMLVEKLCEGGRRMDALIGDVMVLGRLSREKVQIEAVDVEALLGEIIRGRPDFQRPIAHVQIEGPLPRVRGDVASLNQCFSNLLGNAVKFVAPGVSPKVRIYAEAERGTTQRGPSRPASGKVRLWVADNGIGIPPEARDKVFEAFKRLHSQSQYEGTGVGLAIVRKAVERVGGTVGVESEPGQGSRFWVELDRAN